ncbi:hypothetical protein T02_8592 [Trichinella nativa]|uniref:Uncharacterized protein n=1 Tax=Trichinella nativa TaxID=6335 RepID=A0A0V1KKD9_9BILA|nr:hypothetical protein T02_8592 [Trichinella nativa]
MHFSSLDSASGGLNLREAIKESGWLRNRLDCAASPADHRSCSREAAGVASPLFSYKEQCFDHEEFGVDLSWDGPTWAQFYSHSGPLFIYWSLSSLFYYWSLTSLSY